MYTTFHLKASDLDDRFIKAVKTMFKSRDISIVIEEEQDETEYLLSSEANRKVLMERIQDVRDDKNLVPVNLKDL